MPELPEVEIVRLGLKPAMTAKKIEKITINRRDLRIAVPLDFEKKCEKNLVVSMLRRGKYILVLLENKMGFVLHLGMSGRIYIHEPGERYVPAKHDHVLFDMEDGTRIVFNDPRRFGMLYLTHADDWQNQKPFNIMGPEPLGNNFSGPVLHDRLKSKRTSIKAALLDQEIVAGVGNIYACESLYMSGIHPQRQASTLNKSETEKLARAVRDVLNKAIEAGGSSLKDYAHTDGTLGYFQHSFTVYDREGQNCPGCNDNKTGCIKRIVQSGRSTFYCPQRQK